MRATMPGPGLPTEQVPEPGEIVSHGVTVSRALHWVEDGLHVFRSTELDIAGEDEDKQRAIDIFVENAEDLLALLADLIRKDEATPHEIEVATTLAARFVDVYREHDRRAHREERRLIRIEFSRGRRGAHSRGWNPLSTPDDSSQPLPV